MSTADKQRFSDLLDDLGVIYDREVSVTLKRLYWEDLGQYPLDAIAAACQAHRRDPERGRFFPKPADLLARLGAGSRHLPGEAAWAIALESLDEDTTLVWTAEIARAREAARPIWVSGDRYGARAAFLKAYEALLLATSEPPRYQVSVGHDPAQRQAAVERAVRDGLLTQEQARHYLPGPAVTPEGAVLAGLLSGKVVALPQDEATRQRLAALRAGLETPEPGVSVGQARRDLIEERRRQALDYLQARMAEGDDHAAG